MSTIHVRMIDLQRNIGELVAEQPEAARVFEKYGIDYCCGGRTDLAAACQQARVDPLRVIDDLEACTGSLSTMARLEPIGSANSVSELISHIVDVHHVFLRSELPRINALAMRCSRAHGARHPELRCLVEEFRTFADDLEIHMMKEERVLFPLAIALENGDSAGTAHCGGVEFPIAVMEAEHQDAGAALQRFSDLTSHYSVPQDGCGTWIELCKALAALDLDLRHHIHEENNLLHPRLLSAEKSRSR